jgi:hypothetical protein
MTFAPLTTEAVRELSAFIEFRPETNNGLLLFTASRPDAKYDFFSLSLIDGKAEFRYNCLSIWLKIAIVLTPRELLSKLGMRYISANGKLVAKCAVG